MVSHPRGDGLVGITIGAELHRENRDEVSGKKNMNVLKSSR